MPAKKTTKDRILDVSAKLFAKKGFSSTSMNDIIIAAKTTKGALYHHFPSKEELFMASVGAMFTKHCEPPINPSESITKKQYIKKLYEYGYKTLESYQKDPMMGDLQWEMVNQMRKNPHVKKAMKVVHDFLNAQYVIFIEKGIELGVFQKSANKQYLFAKMATMLDVLSTYVAVDVTLFDCKDLWKRTVDEMLQVKN